MPLYNYKCHKCKKEFERIVKNKDDLVFCECGYTSERQVINSINFRLLGTCWEKDGYSKENKNAKS